MADNLTVPEVWQLHTVLDAASRGAKVRWISHVDGETILSGTARHIVKGAEDWGFIGGDQDVRDAFLRITSVTGWDHAVPVRYLMELVRAGGFAVDS